MRDRLVINDDALKRIRTDPAVRADLVRRAKAVAKAAGGEDKGYLVTDLVLEDPRGAASVMATGKAHYENRRRNTLLKALDAGRE